MSGRRLVGLGGPGLPARAARQLALAPLLPVGLLATLPRRRARFAVRTLLVLCLSFGALTASARTASASVASDQADIAQLEQQIAANGARAQALVGRANAVQAHVDDLNAQLAHDERLLGAAQRDEATALSAMRRLAVKAYTNGGATDSAVLDMFSSSSDITATLAQSHYLGAVASKWDNALTTLHLDQARTRDAESGVRRDQAQATATLRELTSARDAATAEIAADQAKLSRVHGDLRALLVAANAKHDAEERAAERALAAVQRPPSPQPSLPILIPSPSPPPALVPPPSSGSPSPPSSPSPPTSSRGYANPLRGITALVPRRIDQGVDYVGFGPIYAMGNGVILSTVGSGWPGGTFIAYQLTDGPARGLVVFAAEDIQPTVQVGQTVTSDTVIGQVYVGRDGIETGWADGTRLPDTMARRYGQYDGSHSTAFGYNFSQLLQSLGAPGGVLTGPPRGELPSSWPNW